MTGFVMMTNIVIQTHFIEISKSYWNLAVVAQNVLDGCLSAVHHSVCDSLSQTRLRLRLLLHPEEEDDRLDGDALKERRGSVIDNTPCSHRAPPG